MQNLYLLYTPFTDLSHLISSDWLKEGHMTWISFDNVHVGKLIQVLLFISLTLEETAIAATEFGTFTVRHGLQNNVLFTNLLGN